MSEVVRISTRIPREEWERFAVQFSEAQRGRMVQAEFVDLEVGDEPLSSGIAFYSLDYDPVNKGDNIILAFGSEPDLHFHLIDKPADLWVAEDEQGVVWALEVVHEGGARTILRFGSPGVMGPPVKADQA